MVFPSIIRGLPRASAIAVPTRETTASSKVDLLNATDFLSNSFTGQKCSNTHPLSTDTTINTFYVALCNKCEKHQCTINAVMQSCL